MVVTLFRGLLTWILPLSLLGFEVGAAGWVLDNDASQLNFISIKADHKAESHTFGELSGRVSDGGEVTFMIMLDSVNTGIDIRNERMRDLLFDTSKYTSAKILAQINIGEVEALASGDSLTTNVEASLDLAGKESTINAELKVFRLNPETIVVTTNQPILLNGENLGLIQGIEKLRDVAGLPSISFAVPVDFSLVFSAE